MKKSTTLNLQGTHAVFIHTLYIYFMNIIPEMKTLLQRG